MRRFALFCTTVGLLAASAVDGRSQATTRSPGSFDFNSSGIVFQTADTSSRVIMRFRMQNQANIRSVSETDLDMATTEWGVRRLRIRFGGHLVDPRLTFNLQLSFARGDIDLTDTQFPNVIRDAMVMWNFTPDLQIAFGQTKLPGNRQRVISSADLQFGERSIVNNTFTLDRDFGLQGSWRFHAGEAVVNLRGALSTGDGRNQGRLAGGLASTGRVEVLPFGAFANGGDYFESDQARETTPKLSIGASYQYNAQHTRTRGQLGPLLVSPRTSDVTYVDALLKYAGMAVYGEYARRTAADPVARATDGRTTAVLVGYGVLAQASYLMPFNLELAARAATVVPEPVLIGLADGVEQVDYSVAATYYLNRHRIKGGLEVGQEHRTTMATGKRAVNWLLRLNVEFGI